MRVAAKPSHKKQLCSTISHWNGYWGNRILGLPYTLDNVTATIRFWGHVPKRCPEPSNRYQTTSLPPKLLSLAPLPNASGTIQIACKHLLIQMCFLFSKSKMENYCTASTTEPSWEKTGFINPCRLCFPKPQHFVILSENHDSRPKP